MPSFSTVVLLAVENHPKEKYLFDCSLWLASFILQAVTSSGFKGCYSGLHCSENVAAGWFPQKAHGGKGWNYPITCQTLQAARGTLEQVVAAKHHMSPSTLRRVLLNQDCRVSLPLSHRQTHLLLLPRSTALYLLMHSKHTRSTWLGSWQIGQK